MGKASKSRYMVKRGNHLLKTSEDFLGENWVTLSAKQRNGKRVMNQGWTMQGCSVQTLGIYKRAWIGKLSSLD